MEIQLLVQKPFHMILFVYQTIKKYNLPQNIENGSMPTIRTQKIIQIKITSQILNKNLIGWICIQNISLNRILPTPKLTNNGLNLSIKFVLLLWYSSKNSKHNWMIEKMKYCVQSFFSYLNAGHSESKICHQIVSFFRVMQLFGPAFFIQDAQFSIKGSLSYWILNIVDLFIWFIPSSSIEHNWGFLLLGYCDLNGLFLFSY